MYYQFFGLLKEPFGMTPDPSFLFLSTAHREALAGLTYSLLSRKGFVVLTGDAGTGKTTLLTRILQSIPQARARFSVVLNPTLTPSEFLELVLLDFGIENIPTSKAQRLKLLEQFLLDAHKQNQVPALVVDEAHKLSPDVLEEIRLLSNFELADSKLLQIVLAGQTELGAVLNRNDLRQLKQRIAVRLAIQPLSSQDVGNYIQHRWQKAGATQPHPFQPQAISLIAQYSHGIPRLINVLSDNALVLAYGEGISSVGPAQIDEVARDLDLREIPKASREPHLSTAPYASKAEISRSVTYGVAKPLQNAGNGVAPISIPTLERHPYYSKPSRLTRLAGVLGFASKPVEQQR